MSRPPATDAQRIAVARAYVDALVSHDSTAVPLHPECVRIEMGVKTGRSGEHIARSLDRGPQFRLIHRISDFTAEVDGATVSVIFYVHVHPKPLRLAARVAERFVIGDDLRIRHIQARIGMPRPYRD